MATKTTLEQLSQAKYDANGVLRFYVTSTLTYVKPGDLPNEEIFVHDIQIANDPKADRFLRVGNIVDMTTLPLGRDAALQRGLTTYLTSSFTVDFPDVDTATAAKDVIQQRVDNAISNWITYQTRFVTPASYEFPASDPTLVTKRINAYNAAKQAKIEKEAALNAATSADTAAKAEAQRLGTALVTAVERSSLCTQKQTLLGQAITAESVFRAAVTSFISSAAAFLNQMSIVAPEATSQRVAFESALNGFKAAATAEAQDGEPRLNALQTRMAADCAAESTEVTTLAAEKVTADTEAAATATALSVATAAYDAAVTVEQAALAAVLEVCPDFQA